MLSIGKLAAGPEAGRYYEKAVAQGREDYYAGEGEAPGRWVGGGPQRLGLAGEVNEGEVGRLLAGEHPDSGGLLGAAMGEGSVAGFDLTFKAPKSVSIVFGIADPEIAGLLRASHEAAISDALGYLEREACRARRGTDGVHVIDGAGFLAAGFQHRTSRAGDPLLHTHVVVANRTLGPDGRWTALDARHVYRHAKTAGYVYQARLRHEIGERLGLGFGEVVKGSADLAGFSRELVEHFSRRRAEILEVLHTRGEHSLLAANTAALATRKGKDYGVPMARLREQWQARAAEHGLDRRTLDRLLTPRLRERQPEAELDLDALTEKASTFTRRDVIQALAQTRRDGATAVELEAAADGVLRDRDVVRIADPAGIRFTTRAQLELERGLLDSAGQRRDEGAAVADVELTEQAIRPRRLSGEQRSAVRHLTTDGHGVEVLRAPAGAGKTFTLDAAREAWQASGKQVIGCALAARAAAELREQAGIDTTTIARLKLAFDRGYLLPPDGVLVVDEAGMVGTRDLATLANHAELTGAKLVLVGDDRQLPEIEAGGAFRALAERHGAIELTEVHRQRDARDRAALNALREGRAEEWARANVEADRVITAPTAPAVRERLVDDWWHAKQSGADARMIALRRADVADLNERAREQMRAAGQLSNEVEIAGKPFARGDEVSLGHNNRHLDVINGDRGRVLDAQPTHVDVELERGHHVRVPFSYIEDGHLDHGYASTAHKAQGATCDRAFVLGSDETYREWGYTALSRHRDSSHFYLTAPNDYLNQAPRELTDRDDLIDTLTRTLDTSRRHELAIEALERDPEADRQSRQQLSTPAIDPLDHTPWLDHDQRVDRDPGTQPDRLPGLPDLNQAPDLPIRPDVDLGPDLDFGL